ncbi:type II secretion system protein [Candidatus Babela massiliensis]|uniref:Type II secretory pathway pseudopilin PulG n=1 Tax=Candidatus Babela massiliensis TaxID=673862 RepID=V6DGB4_9BACT|nr:type II secretion system protein [Candidatus Babela massiliensis]CDK30642.1 Type II secretory pathway pseudopilin PulG [Candidatus Babela massiliensis]
MIIKKQIAFTLFEILIVIAITCFIICLSFKVVNLSDKSLIYIELERLYSCALYLQNQSKVESQDKYILFDEINNQYHYYNNDIKETHKLSSQIAFGFLPNSKGPPSNPTSKIKKAITFNNKKIMFFKDGTVSAGIIYLIDKNKTAMYALSCGISSISYLRQYKYIDISNKWLLLN